MPVTVDRRLCKKRCDLPNFALHPPLRDFDTVVKVFDDKVERDEDAFAAANGSFEWLQLFAAKNI